MRVSGSESRVLGNGGESGVCRANRRRLEAYATTTDEGII